MVPAPDNGKPHGVIGPGSDTLYTCTAYAALNAS